MTRASYRTCAASATCSRRSSAEATVSVETDDAAGEAAIAGGVASGSSGWSDGAKSSGDWAAGNCTAYSGCTRAEKEEVVSGERSELEASSLVAVSSDPEEAACVVASP